MTFKAGLEVQFVPQQMGEFAIVATGEIIDSDKRYTFDDKFLGQSPRDDTADSASVGSDA